ncbi:hypothetical protein GQF56_10615 [Rhodobacter sphaeroides]|jgi:hypothetical protein|uniref:Uncharacterized protein n=1 Tax=Cereibacter sphaeroides (strain ATCC 17023 / DSM 158 / JCM 6121 / CCUG 31486 / LMG 2827 / NBRC 12203 / NCIMB 8253 / ATH 2.4.1.) TaxID=272943 RepID=Q3J415_CERS4|nr:hypothetical protein [Cereibacter sphaeroides]ABA78469.1 hypothetical protein RSP_2315 [Cereibacter sphaeroides 2.4.1]AMJ46821.1 hypothetical protein APX01_04530 [Cereibacter sphaeroides]ANS33534.1 hypothetical protein A3858_04550 [Cereibacter sphaeroides]ATN62577.1 hypothetical protein A3857_04545 [Cereibacter sphaeroides]AXC60691.1 hypothetical protein DQL45_04715 [Cereibacter sphaeroides 2.4.1]
MPHPLRSAAFLTCLVLPEGAFAHNWYPFTCCSDRDCHPIAETEVTAGPKGWVIRRTGEIIGYDDERLRQTPKQAGNSFHLCTTDGKPDGKTICLFVPQFGS